VSEQFSVLAAQITGAHGVGGNVRLRLIGENPDAAVRSLQSCTTVFLAPPKGEESRMLTLASLRKQDGTKGAWIAHFKEAKDRNAAEALVGWDIFIPEDSRAPLPQGEYYVDQLVGLDVITDTGRSLGKMTDVIHSPANDVYETDLGVLIPSVSAFILSVDLGSRQITVRDTPGLLDES
jgi:16S rRNA processing protein RimM